MENEYAKSLFEFQQKFSRSFPKTLEVIKTINTQFYEYIFFFERYTSIVERRFVEDRPREETFPYLIKLAGFVGGISSYFRVNKIYLSRESIEEIGGIVNSLDAIDSGIWYHIGEQKFMPLLVDMIRENSGLSFESVDPNSKDAVKQINEEINKELNKLASRLDKHYKKVVSSTNFIEK